MSKQVVGFQYMNFKGTHSVRHTPPVSWSGTFCRQSIEGSPPLLPLSHGSLPFIPDVWWLECYCFTYFVWSHFWEEDEFSSWYSILTGNGFHIVLKSHPYWLLKLHVNINALNTYSKEKRMDFFLGFQTLRPIFCDILLDGLQFWVLDKAVTMFEMSW